MTVMDELVAFVVQAVPFWGTVGLSVKQAADGHSLLELPTGPQHLQNGIVHGGAIATLLDSTCAMAALSLLWPAEYASSVNLHLAYLRPVTPGIVLTARGECLKAGRTIVFCEAKAWDPQGALVATCSSELMRVPRSPAP
jgi:uncharacterized protein (TIGR00369 family)